MQIDDSFSLLGLAEEYQQAILFYHQACVEEAIRAGQTPMTLAGTIQAMAYSFLAEAQQRDPEARTAFEILLAPQFLAAMNPEAVTARGEDEP